MAQKGHREEKKTRIFLLERRSYRSMLKFSIFYYFMLLTTLISKVKVHNI